MGRVRAGLAPIDPTTEGVKAPNIARYRMSPPVGVWAHLMDRVEAGLT